MPCQKAILRQIEWGVRNGPGEKTLIKILLDPQQQPERSYEIWPFRPSIPPFVHPFICPFVLLSFLLPSFCPSVCLDVF